MIEMISNIASLAVFIFVVVSVIDAVKHIVDDADSSQLCDIEDCVSCPFPRCERK